MVSVPNALSCTRQEEYKLLQMAGESRYQVKPEERINVRAFSSLLPDTPALRRLGTLLHLPVYDIASLLCVSGCDRQQWDCVVRGSGNKCEDCYLLANCVLFCHGMVLTCGMAGERSLRPPRFQRWCGSAPRGSWATASRRSSARPRRWSCTSSRPAPSAARRAGVCLEAPAGHLCCYRVVAAVRCRPCSPPASIGLRSCGVQTSLGARCRCCMPCIRTA